MVRIGHAWPLLMAESGAESAGGLGGTGDTGAAGPEVSPGAGVMGEVAGTDSALDWKSAHLPTEMQRDSFFQQFKDVRGLANTAKSQAEMIGRGIYLPKDDAGPEQRVEAMQKIYDRLGRPAEARHYTMPEQVEMPPNYEFGKDFVGQLQTMAHQSGMNQEQYHALVQFSAQTLRESYNLTEARKAQSLVEGQTQLWKLFGANASQMQQKASGFWEHFGNGMFGEEAETQSAVEAFQDARLEDGSYLKNHPAIVGTFARALDYLGEGELFQSSYHQAGTSTLQTMEARNVELAGKANSGQITSAETQEWNRLAQQLVQARTRDAERPRRVA